MILLWALLSPAGQWIQHISFFLKLFPSAESLILKHGIRWSAKKGEWRGLSEGLYQEGHSMGI